MPERGEVLVAIMNNLNDFAIAENERWYRIPVSSARKWADKRWPPQWLAFYQTKVFGQEGYAVSYYAQVLQIREVFRWEMLPNEIEHTRAHNRYYQLFLGPLQRLPQPIFSRRLRRIAFIPTTMHKLNGAAEINDLYDGSPLEDRLWAELKRLGITAERQVFIKIKDEDYALDFAVYCAKGKLAIETDGDTWHSDPQRIPLDNLRDNDLETDGWKLLRFNTHHINEAMDDYCLPKIAEIINILGGIDTGQLTTRRISLDAPDGAVQPGLFDTSSEDERR